MYYIDPNDLSTASTVTFYVPKGVFAYNEQPTASTVYTTFTRSDNYFLTTGYTTNNVTANTEYNKLTFTLVDNPSSADTANSIYYFDRGEYIMEVDNKFRDVVSVNVFNYTGDAQSTFIFQ